MRAHSPGPTAEGRWTPGGRGSADPPDTPAAMGSIGAVMDKGEEGGEEVDEKQK